MTALAVISALVAALCVGYHLGRRAGSTGSTWKKRTSRVALGRLAINLLVLMTARRVRQSFPARAVSRGKTHRGGGGMPARIRPTSARAKRTRSLSAPRAAASSSARLYTALRT
jgi:hypothetical protein